MLSPKTNKLLWPKMFIVSTLMLGAFLFVREDPASAADSPQWQSKVHYNVDDTVTYNGDIYQGLQSHTSQTGWEPPNVPALWKFLENGSGGSDETSPPPTNGLLPTHTLTGYWQNYTNGATPLRISDVPSNYDLIIVAFAQGDSANPGGITFRVDPDLSTALGGYSKADFINDIKNKHAQGKKVILSIGGEKGNVKLDSSQSISNFVNSLYRVMNEYHFDGIDIDLEHGINVPNLTTALKQLRQKVGPDFILTMAPETLYVQPGGDYLKLIQNVKDIITVVNTQYYNSGSMLDCNGNVVDEGTKDFITGQACILLETLRPDQVGIGLPASPSAAGSGYVNPALVNDSLDCLASNSHCGNFVSSKAYPNIRGVMTYSINWDASNGYKFANTVTPHLDTLPADSGS